MRINLYFLKERVALFDINKKVTSKKSCQLTSKKTCQLARFEMREIEKLQTLSLTVK